MKRFVLTSPAVRDLDLIKNYLVKFGRPGTARRVMNDIRAAIVFISREPGAGHVREDLTGLALKFWPVYSYLVVYEPETKPVQIVRVLHGMRDLESILH